MVNLLLSRLFNLGKAICLSQFFLSFFFMINYKIIILLILLINSFSNANDIKWSKVFDGDSFIFMGIDNSDSNYCMALGSYGEWNSVLKSIDAGVTWSFVYKDSNWSKYFYDISYPTRDFCIVSCDSSSFLKTTDGGNTWNEYKIDIPYSNFGFDDVDMF